MQQDFDPTPASRLSISRALWFVGSAALVATTAHFAGRYPIILAFLVALAIALWAYRRWERARLVRMLRRGEVDAVLAQWSDGVSDLPHAETIQPLVTATAYAAFGQTEDARRALASAARGPAWDAALEHRLFLDAMLSAFEGESDHARLQAARLLALPMPQARKIRERVVSLREAVGALIRAFEHRSRPEDLARLERASERSPLVHWAMLYGAAIIAIDQGMPSKARRFLQGAPNWPAESAFRSFHDQIELELDKT